LIAQQQEIGVASFLTPCRPLSVGSDTSEEREERLRLIAQLASYVQQEEVGVANFLTLCRLLSVSDQRGETEGGEVSPCHQGEERRTHLSSNISSRSQPQP